MKIYINGDSNSAECGQHWIKRVAGWLGWPVVNHALGGGSNPRILRTTREFFQQPQNQKDTFVIIGWTSWEREEWLYQNHYYQINAGGTAPLPPELQSLYRTWVLDSESISQINKSRALHASIHDLHIFLNQKQIKHLFFNALMPFQHEALWDPEARSNWQLNYIGPYDNSQSYYWYLKKQGFDPDANNHYSQGPQEIWADFMIDYLAQTKIFQ